MNHLAIYVLIFLMSASLSSCISKKFSVGIVGGGLGGLASALQLERSGLISNIRIYDQMVGPGLGGASAVAAGLMHPFTPRGKYIYRGLEGFNETLSMLKLVQQSCPHLQHLYSTEQTIVRPCFDQEELTQWTAASNTYPEWLQMEDCEQYANRIGVRSKALGAAVMKRTITIDTCRYLMGMWETIKKSTHCEATWSCLDVKNINEVEENHDALIISSGVGVAKLWPWPQAVEGGLSVPLKFVRGQNLLYKNQNSLKFSVLCGEYVVPRESDGLLIAGATHEYAELETLLDRGGRPDPAIAQQLLQEKVTSLYPSLASLSPVGCNAGVRVVTPRTNLGKVPLIAQSSTDPTQWLLTGFGSRGIIHHALFSKLLVSRILENVAGGSATAQ